MTASRGDPDPRAAPPPRPWFRRRRVQLAIGLAVLLVAFRIALPSILRAQIEKQANATITGKLSVGDVDLWLLLGGVALKDVALLPEGAAPTDPPVVAFKQLYVRVGYLPFLRHTVRVKDFALDGPAVHLERLASGAVPLPEVRVTPAKTPTPPPAAGTPWNVVVDQAALHAGHFELRDHVSEPPETVALSLDDLGLHDFTLLHTADGAPGHGTIEIKIGDGTVRIDSTVVTHEDGYTLTATVDVANLPLDRTQMHAPQLGWRDLTGRVDAHVTLTTEKPGTLPVTGGTLTVRALRIDVPGESEPALAWRSLTVDVEHIGIEERRAAVKRVALDGASVIVTPKAPAPLPLLAGRPPAASAGAVVKEPEPAAKPGAPWSWTVATVEITDTKATVALEPPPLVLEITKGTVTGLDSKKGSRAQVDLQLREEQGTIGLTGSVGLDPLGATLAAKIDGLGLGRLLAATGPAPVQLPAGTLAGNVDIKAEQGPLLVGGTLAIADLAVRLPQGGEDFAAGWKRLELGIKEVRVPGVLPGTAPATPEPVHVDLEQLHLVAPVITLTRTAEGLVLPAAGPPPAEPAKAEPAKTAPAKAEAPKVESATAGSAPATPAAPGVTLTLARLDVENGAVSVLDRTVKPFYRGNLSAMTVKATGLRFPENVFDTVSFTAKLPGGAPFKLDGKESKGAIQVTLDGKALPLQQFNPYVTQAAGYSISGGTLTIGSKVRLDAKGYDSKTRVDFDKLGVAGAEGDSLFLQKVGIPLTLALGLLRDINGRIGLDVPVAGDKSGTRVGLGSIVGQAIVKAILGAAMSPLKMLGGIADLASGGAASLAPEPIPCTAGLPTVDADASGRVDQLSNGMAGAPALRITLRGSAGGPDVRALQEAAVLADLQAKQGVLGSVKNLANRGERNAIRDALAARDTSTLTPEYQKTLDEWASAKTISDDQLRALATARADALKATLVKGRGIDAARVTLGDPAVDREQGKPAVTIGLGG